MPVDEQKKHMEVMQETLKKFNIHHWVKLFFDRLEDVIQERTKQATKVLDLATQKKIVKKYSEANNRVLFLDYDGTLVPFHSDPQAVKPDKELEEIISDLGKTKNCKVVIISGRDKETLDRWMGRLGVDFIGEHGVWIKRQNEDWTMTQGLDNSWKEEIKPILDIYVNKTPGSFIEEKDYSLVWHYRKVEAGLGELRAREIISHLKYLSVNKNLEVLEGNKVVEIKNLEVNKGSTALKWLSTVNADFILAVGDDWTDEDTFKSLPDDAFTIKVGSVHSAAKYSIKDYKSVRNFLKMLSKEN